MILADTNVLLRYAEKNDPAYSIVDSAIRRLASQDKKIVIVSQNIYEFWVAATRPIKVNGLELSTAECVSAIARIKRLFPLLPDRPELLAEWETLVATHGCMGKSAHDARLAAAMRTHGLDTLLTFNGSDFRRFPGLTVLDPATVA